MYMENENTVYLPAELIAQILLSLPVKSLIRFKCISKSWFSLISDSNFANSHYQISQSTHTPRNRILSISLTSPPQIRSIDFDALLNDGQSASLNLDCLLQQSYFPLEIKGSCRGFIFLRHISTFSLWNPSTGFHKPIPFSPFHSKLKEYRFTFLYGFGYDPSTDDYLLVIFSCATLLANVSSQLEVFSSRDNTWKEIEGIQFPPYGSPYHNQPKPGTLCNGAIHWLVFHRDLMVHVIVVFDLMERKLLEVNLPNDLEYPPAYFGLCLFEEFLGIWERSYAIGNHTLEIWVMKDYKLHSSWTKTLVLLLNDSVPIFSPICSTKSSDIIGTTFGGYGLVKYNDKRQLSEYSYFYNNQQRYEVAVYTESLLSLPGDHEQVEEDDTIKKKDVLK